VGECSAALFLCTSHFYVASAVLRYVYLRPFLRLSLQKYGQVLTFIILCDPAPGIASPLPFCPQYDFMLAAPLNSFLCVPEVIVHPAILLQHSNVRNLTTMLIANICIDKLIFTLHQIQGS